MAQSEEHSPGKRKVPGSNPGRSLGHFFRSVISHSSLSLFLRMVRWCIRLTRLTLVCEVIRYRLVQVRQNQKILFGLAARKRLSLSLPLSFSPSSYFLSFSIQKMTKKESHCRRTTVSSSKRTFANPSKFLWTLRSTD